MELFEYYGIWFFKQGTEARASESEHLRSLTFLGVLEKLSSEARSDYKSMKRSSEYKSIQL